MDNEVLKILRGILGPHTQVEDGYVRSLGIDRGTIHKNENGFLIWLFDQGRVQIVIETVITLTGSYDRVKEVVRTHVL